MQTASSWRLHWFRSYVGEKVVLPPLNVIERICALAITRANRKICLTLAETLHDGHRVVLEGLLRQPTGSTSSTLAWLRQTPGASSAKHLLEHLQRLKESISNRGLIRMALP
jgi:hypothetical protein